MNDDAILKIQKKCWEDYYKAVEDFEYKLKVIREMVEKESQK